MDTSDTRLEQALHGLHTPETFGRAVLDAVLRAALERGDREMTASFRVAPEQPGGTIPVCFFLYSYEICINIPVA